MFGMGHESAHSLLGVLDALGFTDMYHSWWFLTFLLLFAANLIICSLERLPRVWKLVQEKIPARSLLDYLGKMSIRRALNIKGKVSGVKESAAAAMQSVGFNLQSPQKPVHAALCREGQLYAARCIYYASGAS